MSQLSNELNQALRNNESLQQKCDQYIVDLDEMKKTVQESKECIDNHEKKNLKLMTQNTQLLNNYNQTMNKYEQLMSNVCNIYHF